MKRLKKINVLKYSVTKNERSSPTFQVPRPSLVGRLHDLLTIELFPTVHKGQRRTQTSCNAIWFCFSANNCSCERQTCWSAKVTQNWVIDTSSWTTVGWPRTDRRTENWKPTRTGSRAASKRYRTTWVLRSVKKKKMLKIVFQNTRFSTCTYALPHYGQFGHCANWVGRMKHARINQFWYCPFCTTLVFSGNRFIT